MYKKKKLFFLIISFVVLLVGLSPKVFATEELTCVYEGGDNVYPCKKFHSTMIKQTTKGTITIYINEERATKVSDSNWKKQENGSISFGTKFQDKNGKLAYCPSYISVPYGGNSHNKYALSDDWDITRVGCNFKKVSGKDKPTLKDELDKFVKEEENMLNTVDKLGTITGTSSSSSSLNETVSELVSNESMMEEVREQMGNMADLLVGLTGTDKTPTSSELDYDYPCNNTNVRDAMQLIGYIVYIIKWLVPLIIIVLGMIDYGKAVVSGDEQAVGKATGSIFRRVIAGLVVFFIPTLILGILKFIEVTNGIEEKNNANFGACTKCIFDPFKSCS